MAAVVARSGKYGCGGNARSPRRESGLAKDAVGAMAVVEEKNGGVSSEWANLLQADGPEKRSMPLYKRISRAIAHRIETGRLAVGSRMPTDIELAAQLGTSPVTVAKAYRDLSVGGLVMRKKKQGTFVRNARRRYGKFLFIAPDVGTFYIDSIIAGVSSVLKDRYDLIIRTHPHGEQADHIGMELDRQEGVDGVLTIGAKEESCRRALERGVKVVALAYENPAVPYVVVDNVAVGRLAAKYLLEKGCTVLGAICSSVYSDGRDRLLGFRAAVEQAGLLLGEDHLLYIRHPKRFHLSEAELEAMFRWTPRPRGIFAYNDALGLQVAVEALKRGLRIPDDLYLIGVDNYRWLYGGLQMASIDLNLRCVGQEGANLLVKMVEEGFTFPPGREHAVRVEPTLVSEDS